jgi:hypothetical protein
LHTLQQEGNLCAQHALNALLQGPYFTVLDLANIARRLDAQERSALSDGRISVDDDLLRAQVRTFFHALSNSAQASSAWLIA